MGRHGWSQTDTASGRFVRQRQPWIPDEWDNGRVNNRGRFVVFRPDYPRAWASGYSLRSHVHWWMVTGDVVPVGANLHHINEDRLDDRIENLQLLGHGDHTRLHSRKPGVGFNCLTCGEAFTVPAWRVRQRWKEGHLVKYCSARCYQKRSSV